MKLDNILNDTFRKTLVKLSSQDMFLDTAAKLNRIIETVNKASADFDKDRMILLNIYAEKNDDGSLKLDAAGSAIIPAEKASEFMEHFNVLINLEVAIEQIQFDRFPTDAKISPVELSSIKDIIAD